MSRVKQTELQQAQFHLLRSYAPIERKLRSWYPGANWREEEIAGLKEELERRNEAEQTFLQLLRAACHEPRSPAEGSGT